MTVLSVSATYSFLLASSHRSFLGIFSCFFCYVFHAYFSVVVSSSLVSIPTPSYSIPVPFFTPPFCFCLAFILFFIPNFSFLLPSFTPFLFSYTLPPPRSRFPYFNHFLFIFLHPHPSLLFMRPLSSVHFFNIFHPSSLTHTIPPVYALLIHPFILTVNFSRSLILFLFTSACDLSFPLPSFTQFFLLSLIQLSFLFILLPSFLVHALPPSPPPLSSSHPACLLACHLSSFRLGRGEAPRRAA